MPSNIAPWHLRYNLSVFHKAPRCFSSEKLIGAHRKCLGEPPSWWNLVARHRAAWKSPCAAKPCSGLWANSTGTYWYCGDRNNERRWRRSSPCLFESSPLVLCLSIVVLDCLGLHQNGQTANEATNASNEDSSMCLSTATQLGSECTL